MVAQMDGTMMTKMCKLQRFTEAYLVPELERNERGKDTAQIRIKEDLYKKLLNHLKVKHPELRNYYNYPHPAGSKILQPFATPMAKFTIKKSSHTIGISAKRPNNCVCYKMEGGLKQYGMITQIYRFENGMGGVQEGALVQPITNKFGIKLNCPSQNFRYYVQLMGCIIGSTVSDLTILIDPAEIISVAAYRILPPHTFGLIDGGIILKTIQ